MFEVVLSPDAGDFYGAAQRPLARKLARCFSQLENEPRRRNNIKPLTGEFVGRLRYRIGDWRVIYRIDDRSKKVHVLVIGDQSEVYE